MAGLVTLAARDREAPAAGPRGRLGLSFSPYQAGPWGGVGRRLYAAGGTLVGTPSVPKAWPGRPIPGDQV